MDQSYRALWVCLALLLAGVAHADGAHHGSADPLSEGWTLEPGDTDPGASAVAPDPDFPGVFAWQVNASTQRRRYRLPGPAAGTSWTLRARMRVVDLGDALDANILLEVANGATRWLAEFGSNANGDTLMSFSGGGSLALPAVQAARTDYFRIEIAYNHTEASADVFVNDVEQLSNWTGIAGALSRVNFGDGQTSGTGRGRYEDVVFTSGAQACRDGIDGDGDGLVDFAGGDPDCASANDPSESDPDHDEDGLLDGFEVAHGFDPLDPDEDLNGRIDGHDDSDLDGLGNAAEQPAGTDPGDPDSDDDGLLDGAELGSGSFGPQQVISTAADSATSVFAADVDGDGDLDVLSASFSDDEIAWYENTDGAGSFGAQQLISTAADGAFSVFGADVDGDGDLDVLSASVQDAEIAWYENSDGAGSFGVQQLISTAASSAISVFGADMDGDGDLDVLSASASDHKIAWYENTDGAGSFGAQQVIWTPADGAVSVFAADVDGDGDLDVLSASVNDDKIAWYENESVADPLDPDSDDDGLLDGFEVAHGFDPLGADESAGDPDVDGLTNLQEQAAGTDPNDADSDGDGFPDGVEVAAGTNPLDPFDFPAPPIPALGRLGAALLAGLLACIGIREARRRH